MCGRFYVDEKIEKEIWNIVRDVDQRLKLPTVGEIRPADSALIIHGESRILTADTMRWGFKQYSSSSLIINARSETVTEKPVFSDSIWQRRCVIPASWFYEWNSKREKVTFKRTDGSVLYMAGFYQRYEEGNCFVILTTGANNSMKPVHDRMPVILDRNELEEWVYDDGYMKYILNRTPIELMREQEYEQQSFIFYV